MVDREVQLRPAVARDLLGVGTAGRDVASTSAVPGCVVCTWRSTRSGTRSPRALVVAHHRRIRELAAQGLDLDAISNGLNGTHRIRPCHIEAGRAVVALDGVLCSGLQRDTPHGM
jgi:hypothetical protein